MCNNVSADVMLAGHIKTVVQQVSMYVNHFTQKTLDGGQVELTKEVYHGYDSFCFHKCSWSFQYFKYHCLSYLLIMASCLTGRE